MFESDSFEAAIQDHDELADPRVVSCYDRQAATSGWLCREVIQGWPAMQSHPVFRRGLVWDTFLLYPAQAGWGDLRSGCLAGGATVLLERQILLRGLSRLFP